MGGIAAEAGKSAPDRSVVEHLKEQIRRVQAAPRRYLVTLATGAPELDALGVFRMGSAVELSGEEASGRTTVASSKTGVARQAKLGGRTTMDTPPEPVKRAGLGEAARHADTPARPVRPRAESAGEASAWMDDSRFTSSRVLVDLLKPAPPVPKKRRG